MREQVMVDKPESYPFVCMDCANNLIMDYRLLIKREEYERLNRLDENVNKQIYIFKKFLDSDDEYTARDQHQVILELLQRLYK